jgi:hypothetical protein
VVAWGQRRRLGLPWQAALVMRQLPGTSLERFLASNPSPEDRRRAMLAVGAVAGRLYGAGLSWPDISPKHFYLCEDLAPETTGVLDLARMRPASVPRALYMPRQLRKFFRRLRACNGGQADQETFLAGLGRR